MTLSKKIVETMGIALIAVDPRGHVVFSNPAATRLFGHPSNQLAALHISELLPDWGAELHEDQSLPPDAAAVLREVVGYHKNGKSLTLAIQFAPWSTEAEGLNYTLVLRDIAAELEMERARYADEQRMAHAVLGSRIGIFEVDVLNQTSQVSGAWHELMEISSTEDIDPQTEWLNRIHPNDLPIVQKADKDCIDGLSNRSLADYRMRSRNGTEWRWMRSDAVAAERDENGVATRIIGAQTDITESKSAEQALQLSERQFRSAMENAPIGKALLAPDGRWLMANSAFCKFLGYTEGELLEVDFQTITHPDDLERDVEHVKRLLAGVERTYSMEKRYLRSDGEIVWAELSVALVRDEKGAPLHFISQIVDITDRRRLDRMKRDFVATVSHELRTPVTAISAALDLIDLDSQDGFSEKKKKLISITHENARRLRLLLDDILDFDRLSSDKMPINPVRTNVIEMAECSIRATQPYLDQYNVEVMLESPDQSPFSIIDPARLEQVLTNLLSNAAKFSQNGGMVRVRIETEGDQVCIAIIDRGIGIPTEFHEAIFQPFSQVAPSDTRNRMGTGLGLSISKQLIERMGGTIGVKSKAEEGSEFWIKLSVYR